MTSPPPPQNSSSPDLRRIRTREDDRRRRSVSSGPRLNPIRRQSTQERINEILETGLARAESSKSESRSAAETPTATKLQQPRMEPLLSGAASRPGEISEQYEDDTSPDEGTGIVRSRSTNSRRQAEPNYQSTAMTAAATATTTGATHERIGGTGRSGSSISHRQPAAGSQQSQRQRSHSRRTAENAQTSGSHAQPSDGYPAEATAGGGGGLFSRWKKSIASLGSVELENKGSVARDHLALERTFLAWLRTSVSFASIGIAVTQLFRLNTSINSGGSNGSQQPPLSPAQEQLRRLGKPLGAAFLGVSILILFLGYSRYVRSQKWIMTGRFPASRGTVILVTLITFAVMVASLAIVVAFTPEPQDR